MDLALRRLRHQFIDHSNVQDPTEIVRALCAVQAQEYYAALWAVGLRTDGAREADIERAIAERRIVRTWPLRGTLHFVAAEDVRWMLGLLAPRVLQRNTARLLRDFAIDSALIKRTTKIVKAELGGGRAVTRAALYERLEQSSIATDKQRGMHLLWWLAHEGLICCGPRDGKQHTFVLLDEWVPADAKTPRREDALTQLATRYFAHHGPATLADFAWWSGLTAADAKAALEAVKPHLAAETVGKSVYWSGAERASRSRRASCHLLPVYDELTIGYADRSASLDPAEAAHATAGYGVFRAPIVIDGRIVGSWTRELARNRVAIHATPLRKFSREQLRAIEQAAQRYGEFLNLTPELI